MNRPTSETYEICRRLNAVRDHTPPKRVTPSADRSHPVVVALLARARHVPPWRASLEQLSRARAIVHTSILFDRFISGTPLENDIAVWMWDFVDAAQRADPGTGMSIWDF